MIAAYLKENKPRSKLLVLDGNPEIISKCYRSCLVIWDLHRLGTTSLFFEKLAIVSDIVIKQTLPIRITAKRGRRPAYILAPNR